MNNRTPLFALGALVLLAVVWKIVSPSPPVPPGPLGEMPGWYSGNKLGSMGPSAVNPAGTMWAGAWNQKTDSGKLRSAVWVVDFEKKEPRTCVLDEGLYVSSLTWADDNTIRILALDKMKPEDAGKSAIVSVDAKSAEKKGSQKLKTPVARILAWGKDEMLAELAGDKSGQMAVISPDGAVRGKTVSLDAGKDAQFGTVAAVSGDVFVFSESGSNTGDPVYYMGNAQTGEAKSLFSVTDLPGRVEDILLSDKNSADIGVVVYDGKMYDALVYDCIANKLKGRIGPTEQKVWNVKPFNYVNYQGGLAYRYSDKPGKLFSFSKASQNSSYWITYVQDGRIYKLRDGSYASVSQVGDLIDIRIINKDGTLQSDLLPRR